MTTFRSFYAIISVRWATTVSTKKDIADDMFVCLDMLAALQSRNAELFVTHGTSLDVVVTFFSCFFFSEDAMESVLTDLVTRVRISVTFGTIWLIFQAAPQKPSMSALLPPLLRSLICCALRCLASRSAFQDDKAIGDYVTALAFSTGDDLRFADIPETASRRDEDWTETGS
jgi:hypothetical protein